jgi:hypothetical protein
MAYTVNKSNTAASPNQYTVQDSILNTQTDVPFVGKGYAGYGEVIAENFLHLLENFSNTSAPGKPIKGQIWYDETSAKIKVYTGSAFQPVGGATYSSVAPAGLTAGDLFIDSDTQQLFFNNGAANVLVGPPASSGTINGFVYSTISDSNDIERNITRVFNSDVQVAIISDSSFTPKIAIAGFATITKGINLSTLTVSGNYKFTGTSTNSDALGGEAAGSYLRIDGASTSSTTRSLSIINDVGLTIGQDSDFRILIDNVGVHMQNNTVYEDLIFRVKDGGTITTVMTIEGSTARMGIGTVTPTTKLDVVGTVNATAFTGPITGAVSGSAVTVTEGGDGLAIVNGSFKSTISSAALSANRTFTLPNRSGTVITSSDTGTVSAAMLKDSVTLQILDSTGTVLKTIYGAGS